MNFFQEPNHAALTRFYSENELEIEPGWEQTSFFSLCAEENGQLIGAATLSMRFGVVLLDYIAIAPAYRKSGLGKRLFLLVLAQNPSIKTLYLTARAPGFFQALGCKKEDAFPQLLGECLHCPQYQNECTPAVMRYDREETK